jgi:hypothetical protein
MRIFVIIVVFFTFSVAYGDFTPCKKFKAGHIVELSASDSFFSGCRGVVMSCSNDIDSFIYDLYMVKDWLCGTKILYHLDGYYRAKDLKKVNIKE